MARRPPGSARFLGLWTAGWLAVLLGAGIGWVGDLGLQWPVLVVPLLWAGWALRPRRRGTEDRADDRLDDRVDGRVDGRAGDSGGERTTGIPRPPATRELPGLPRVPPPDRRPPW